MIAIAGAKGGCGKTVTTLGLADAYTRKREPALAVDADRQLPTLHVTAEIDREPTIAGVDDPADVTTVAQQLSDNPRVGVLPAPTEEESVNFERTLGMLAEQNTRVFVDCPSGAGPDVIEPLGAADLAVVVSTGTERSLRAAETTLDVARRVDVPVAGVLLTHCAEVPEDVARRFEVPVLGAVPERDAPLRDDDARAVYDEVVDTIVARQHTSDDGPANGPQLGTGVEPLDDALQGGVPAGSIVALEGAPAGRAEQLLYRLTETRGTLYTSTVRSEMQVRSAIGESLASAGSPTIRRVDGPDRLAEARALVGELPDGANLIVDPVDVLEESDREEYVAFLETLAERVVETEGVAVLHALRGQTEPAHRSLTEHVADVVLEVEETVDEDGRSTTVTVSKLRGVSGPSEPVELELPGDVAP